MYESLIDLLCDGDNPDRDNVRSQFFYDTICELAKEKTVATNNG